MASFVQGTALEELYSPDVDVVKQTCGGFRNSSTNLSVQRNRFIRMMSTSFLVHPLRIIALVELDSDKEASTFQEALPQGEHKWQLLLTQAPVYGSLPRRLILECLDVERKQPKLIMEEVLKTTGSVLSMTFESLHSIGRARIPRLHHRQCGLTAYLHLLIKLWCRINQAYI
jgi:hypothetical protein